jgi:ABC-type molybdate transport system permease subunit
MFEALLKTAVIVSLPMMMQDIRALSSRSVSQRVKENANRPAPFAGFLMWRAVLK